MDLATILNKVNESVRANIPGVEALSVDVFVNHATFLKLKEANLAAFSLSDDEPALTVRYGDVELIILEAGDDE